MSESTKYKTRQRSIILECLKNGKEHWTVDMIADSLKNKGNAVGKSTIYRYLDKLVESGQVRKYFTESSSSACYQYIAEDTCKHYHLKCTACGMLIHLECGFLSELEEHVSEMHQFRIDECKTVFYGLCYSCK